MRLPQGESNKNSLKNCLRRLQTSEAFFFLPFSFSFSVFCFLDFSPRKQMVISFVPHLTRNEASNLSYSVFT
jgi:hypothetical protein